MITMRKRGILIARAGTIVACSFFLTLCWTGTFVVANNNYDEQIEVEFEKYRADLLQSWLKDHDTQFDSLGITYAVSEGRGVVAKNSILSRETVAVLPRKTYHNRNSFASRVLRKASIPP